MVLRRGVEPRPGSYLDESLIRRPALPRADGGNLEPAPAIQQVDHPA
jgi:hypothetical protein